MLVEENPFYKDNGGLTEWDWLVQLAHNQDAQQK